MSSRPVPLTLALAVCALLLAAASTLTVRSLALAADGSFYLVRVLGEDRVFGPDARLLANAVRQGPVLLAARAGLHDTHALALLLGLGQLVLPALAWSAAVLLARSDRVAFAAVSMTAGVCAGATWLFSVSESVLAAPLTALVAVLLWQPRPWKTTHAALAVAASSVLVASYETAVVSGALLATWATWRAVSSTGAADRYGAGCVAATSVLSVVTAAAGAQDSAQPSSGEAFLYHLVSLEPWQAYLALAGVSTIVVGWLVAAGALRRVLVAAGTSAVALATLAQDATSSSAYQCRAAAVLASVALTLFLWWRWATGRHREADALAAAGPEPGPLLVPVAVVVLLLVPGLRASGEWAKSLDAFRAQVARAHGAVPAEAVLPPDRRSVLFDWTSSSLSILVRGDPGDGVLVDRRPSLVPFEPEEARDQLSDEFTWGGAPGEGG